MRKLVIGMAMASTALTTPAMARDGQWYIQGDGGVMVVEDQDIDVNGVSGDARANYNTGYDFGAVVGYDFGAFRLETEASYRAANVDDVAAGGQGLQIDPVGTRGGRNGRLTNQTAPALWEINALSFMVNGLFDFGSDDGLQAFAGGGIGVARVDMNAQFDQRGPGAYNDSDTGLAWQLLAGVRAPLSESWDIGLKYRYFNMPDIGILDTIGRPLESKLSTHSLLGSITYNFGGEEPVAAPVVVPPPPPPPFPFLMPHRLQSFNRSDKCP